MKKKSLVGGEEKMGELVLTGERATMFSWDGESSLGILTQAALPTNSHRYFFLLLIIATTKCKHNFML